MCTFCYTAVGFVFVPHVFSTILAVWLGYFRVVCKKLPLFKLVSIGYFWCFIYMTYTEDECTSVE